MRSANREVENWRKINEVYGIKRRDLHLVRLYEAWYENGYFYSSSEY